MTIKRNKPKKAVLRVDASQLLGQLNNLLREGKDMAAQSIVDGKAYDTWNENVRAALQLGFKDSDNEYYKKFIPLPTDYLVCPDNGSSSHMDDQFKWMKYLIDDLNRLNSIIIEITSFYQ